MFREMRRKDKEITPEDTALILEAGEYGTLATVCEDGRPYAIAISYIWLNGCIYFHCAKDGQKLSNIQRDARVCFSVVTDTKVLPAQFSMQYKSAVVFGTASVVYGDEKQTVMVKLIEKYAPEYFDVGEKHIAKSGGDTVIVRIDVAHMTGKAKT